jgi:hypothetical protein
MRTLCLLTFRWRWHASSSLKINVSAKMSPKGCPVSVHICKWCASSSWVTVCSKSSLTFLLTPWSRVLLEKLTGLQLFNKFPAFYGTRMFITAFTSVRHLSILSQLNPVHTPTSLFLKILSAVCLNPQTLAENSPQGRFWDPQLSTRSVSFLTGSALECLPHAPRSLFRRAWSPWAFCGVQAPVRLEIFL